MPGGVLPVRSEKLAPECQVGTDANLALILARRTDTVSSALVAARERLRRGKDAEWSSRIEYYIE